MKKYTRIATNNFIKKADEVIAAKPIVKGEVIDNYRKLAKVLGVHQSLFTNITGADKRAVTLEQLATFCHVFDYDISEMVFNTTKHKQSELLRIADKLMEVVDRIRA